MQLFINRVLLLPRHGLQFFQSGQGVDQRLHLLRGKRHPGDMVPVALDHSTLPGGKKIEKGKLRGVESNGMMCGLYELGLDERDFP